jgi:hypothetical protein
MRSNRQRIYASLLGLGAGILIFRTVSMVLEGSVAYLTWWVAGLLFLEMAIDLACLLASVRWFVHAAPRYDRLPLRLGTAAALLHAFRVLVFVLGRTGPWVNFDVRPAFHASHGERWTWADVWFASIMSVLGIIGVVVIWRIRVRNRRRARSG